ncbi:MAG: hypothetical protein IJF66_07315 [Clostridia bacterium]|nr:hypothetical protein [Clostridia bacterium]
MKINNDRTRNWSLVTYLTKDKLLLTIANLDNIRYFAFIEHDKDKLENNEPKPRHIHLALVLKSARTVQQITKKFTNLEENAGNCFGEPTKSNKAIIQYFLHINEKDKYQYNEEDIISNNLEYFKNDTTEDIDNCYLIIEDIMKGKSLLDLVKVYGRELLYHYNQYKEIVKDIQTQELDKKLKRH